MWIEGKTKPIIRSADDGLGRRIPPWAAMIPGLGCFDYATQGTGSKGRTMMASERESPTLQWEGKGTGAPLFGCGGRPFEVG